MAEIKRIKLGMVGGGQDAFIGAIHRMASRIDDHFEFVAGALSSNPERAKSSGLKLGLAWDRIYDDFKQMAKQEAKRADGIDAVAIVTPNHMHYPVAKAFLEAGIHVICDKPMTSTLKDAHALHKLIKNSPALFILTHTYTGYPLVRTARDMINNDMLGDIRLVQVEYAQDWLAMPLEDDHHKQASWRTDPNRSGIGGAIADIGTHAANLVSFMTNMHISSVAADLHSFVENRQLDDNAHVLLRLKNDDGKQAKGMLWASQVAVGQENNLGIRIFGSKGAITWKQENPNEMIFSLLGKPDQRITRAMVQENINAAQATRTPPGHPEGYLEAFANIYTDVATAIKYGSAKALPLPDVKDGLAGLQFIEACVRSSKANSAWISCDL